MSHPRVAQFADPWQPAVAHGWLLALPQSAQIGAPGLYVWDERDWAISELQQHLEILRTTYPLDSARGIIGGFSMGGGIALWLALTGTLPIRGVLAVAPWLGSQDISLLEQPIAEGKADNLHVTITVSEQDEDCCRVSQGISALLTKRGVKHTLDVTQQAGHAFPDHFGMLLNTMLTRVGET